MDAAGADADSVYEPAVRRWRKYKVRETTEAIVGTITGSLAVPRTVLPGRYDAQGRFQHLGRRCHVVGCVTA
jgi:hypothetical protein